MLQLQKLDKITIRQTTDPCVDDVQYIAWREIALERDGSLHMKKIRVGLGMPGEEFVVGFLFCFWKHYIS
jgi:hypothetical protein